MLKPFLSSQSRRKLFITSLGIIAAVIGVSETLVMILLAELPGWGIELPPMQEAALDTTLLAIVTTPLLWLFSLRPLAIKIADQEQSKLNSELRTALDAHALVSIADAQGRIVHVNDEFCKISGFSLDELLGQDQRMIHSSKKDRDIVFNLWRTLQPGQHWKGEFCNLNQQGGHYWVDTTIVPLWDDEGKPSQYISIFRDITAQKESEAKLKALKRALDACNEMIFITNGAGAIQYANPAFHQVTGWAEDEVIGRRPDILNSPNVDREVLSEMYAQLKRGQAWFGRLLNGCKNVTVSPDVEQSNRDGTPDFWADINVTPIQNADGSLFGYVQVQRDISRQVKQEEALQIELENNMARLAIAEVLQQPQPTKDSFGQILAILLNLKTFNSLRKGGVLLKDQCGQHLEIAVWQGEFSREFKQRKHSVPSRPYSCEYITDNERLSDFDQAHQSGSQGHYSIPIAASGEFLGILFLYADPESAQYTSLADMLSQVGEMMALALLQEQAKTALEAARDSALKTAQAKSEFLANMSHEIRTPMNGVLGMLDLLRDTEMSRMQKELLETAANSAESLLDIINDILDFSKLGAGKIELEQVEFNLHTLVEDVCSLLAGRAHAKDLELNCLLPADLPIRWQGDPTRIRQILTNLIGNAVKFTEQGEVSVMVRLPNEPEQAGLRFEIKDTGIGITADAQKRLFQPFSQSDNSTARRFGGTGLGLSICKDLLMLMEGDIGLESEPNVGTTFWFTVPVLPADSNSPAPLTDLTGKRALVVDDNATNRKILNHYLSYWGCIIGETDNAIAGLSELEAAVRCNMPYDFLLSDLHMPDMDGIAFMKAINGNPAITGIPRLILSSGALSFEAEHQELGIAQTLQKPVRQRQLFDAIVSALQIASRRPAKADPVAEGLPNYSGRRVLVVEDNKVNQKVILSILAKFQLKADLAENGRIALDKVARHAYDLVLMDCQMPVMDGYEAARILRAREQDQDAKPRLPVVAVTAHAATEERDKCLAAGMDDYVSKPVTRAALMEIFLRWLGEPLPDNSRPQQAEGITPQKPVEHCWDEVAALKQLDGDEELLYEMIDLFLDEAPERLNSLTSALVAGDLPELADIAHTLKGMAGHFFAEALKKRAVVLEKNARNAAEMDFHLLTEELREATLDLIESLMCRKGILHAR